MQNRTRLLVPLELSPAEAAELKKTLDPFILKQVQRCYTPVGTHYALKERYHEKS